MEEKIHPIPHVVVVVLAYINNLQQPLHQVAALYLALDAHVDNIFMTVIRQVN